MRRSSISLREHPRLLEHRYQVRLVGRVEAVEHALESALHDGQRRAQLVADVGEQAATGRIGLLEPRAHGVEGARQRSDLGWSADLDLGPDLARLDPAGRLDEIADRRGRAAQHAPKAADHDDEDEERQEGGERHRWMPPNRLADDVDEERKQDRERQDERPGRRRRSAT